MRKRYQVGGLAAAADEDLQAGSDDYPANDDDAATTGDTPSAAYTAAGGLSALDTAGTAQAMAALIKSSNEARAALQKAREQILARKYNRAIPLLAASAALGAPTRAGSTAESFANMSGALIGPLREKQAFEEQQQKELLGIGTSLSGLDQNAAMAQLQLAALKAKLASDAAKTPLDKVMVNGVPRYATHSQALGQQAWVPTPASTNVSVNTEKSLYGKMADQLGEQYTNQYMTALKAPQVIERTHALRDLLKTKPYTGSGANFKLMFGKAAKALGFDYAGDDIKNTEVLASRLGQEALDNVKSSGLAGSQGLTEGERKFLLDVVGGHIGLDEKSLERLAEIHERTARNSVDVWNDTYSRLKKPMLDELGVTQIKLAPPRSTAPPPPPATAEAPSSGTDEPAGNPDDTRAAVAPPQAEETLRRLAPTHPELKQQFIDKYGYLPDGV